jgi:hypothetical protein
LVLARICHAAAKGGTAMIGTGTTCKTTKKYPRVTAGPLRHQYIHRIVAAAMIGRALTKDEEVNHKDRNRLNFWFTNLFILGNEDHGWVSAKQAHFMRHKDEREKLEWDAFMAEQEAEQNVEIARARNEGVPWAGKPSGYLKRQYEEREIG